MNASTATAGAWSATAPTTNTKVAAMLYAGATDAVAMTVLEISPKAPDLRPLSSGCSWDVMACSAVAIPHPSGIDPADQGECDDSGIVGTTPSSIAMPRF